MGLTHLHDPECLGRDGDCEDVQDGKERLHVESLAGHSDNSKECASVREGELEGNGCGTAERRRRLREPAVRMRPGEGEVALGESLQRGRWTVWQIFTPNT